uniref:TYRO protein tyrosine kinase-binding protein n=1 Tax=Seriola lalandi dorsalis TaxID=1841481 RepID=A0A3B4XF98_SERLL
MCSDTAIWKKIRRTVAISLSLTFPPRPETNIQKMSDALSVFWFCVSILFLHSFTECGSCYLINMESVIAIIASDIILTIFITISVFCFATQHKRRKEWDSHDGRRNLPSSVSKKMPTEVTESPYQVK